MKAPTDDGGARSGDPAPGGGPPTSAADATGAGPPAGGARANAPGRDDDAGSAAPDLITAAVLFAVAGGIVAETAGYPESLVPGAPGPGFFPRFLAGLLALLAVLLAGRALSLAGRAREPPPAGDVPGTEGLGRIGLALLLLLGFLLGVDSAGVFLLLPPLLGGVMAIMGERRPGILVAVPLLFDLFVYVVFYRVFSVDLPTLFL